MLRTLFSPRLVGLHLVTIGVLISFTLLGRWQLGVFEDSGKPHAATDPAPVALSTLVQEGKRVPVEALSRRVTAEGTFDASRQLLVAERAPTVETGGGAQKDAGFWLLTPLKLADGSLMPVVRGWIATASDPGAAVPSGQVRLSGRVQPSEPSDFARRRTAPLPEGQIATVTTAQLINVWHGARLHDGFVVATSQVTPAPAGGPGQTSAAPETPESAQAGSQGRQDLRLVAVPGPTASGGFTWRNLAYAAQWWIFAAFAVFMWFHFVRDAVRTSRTASTETSTAALGTSPQA
ncbi:SURF1-like protein [Sphaerisporangium krabiense]|uniref:SURF1-like protein n=1 Tax=Sphaerisporangium krabiense TaxID=763782 RepID=A0A7W8YZ79_9ACTN|nr:SURF1 family protein [Sphaerisporangium krabiense]MBB5624539.1 cytochrome oxidase assembly protein ShyY1 [Sphaerisporangium krabiense]GII61505.1 SURF1-like protein [Sphaerisporangium krabiense]